MGKAIRNIKKKIQTGVTAVRLAKRVTNPKNVAKVTLNAARGKGVVLPGSKYIGPGNPMNRGRPKSRADALAYQHDIDYDNYIKSGVKPKKVYTRYSDADDRLRKESKKSAHKDPNAMAAYLGMSGKRLLHKTGLVGRVRDQKVYGDSGKPTQPSEYQKLSDEYIKSYSAPSSS